MQSSVIFREVTRFRTLAIAITIALIVSILSLGSTAAHADASTGSAGLFVSKTARIWDTTTGRDGAPTTPMVKNTWYTVGVQGMEGLPAAPMTAVEVNFYVSSPVAAGVLHADKSSSAAPNATVSYVNYGTSDQTNSATIAVGADGKIRVQVTQSADLRIDVQGYYTAGATTAPGGYVPVPISTIKTFQDVADNTYLPGFTVGGVGAIPTNASGVMLSITETGPEGSNGYIIAYPTGNARPGTALYWPGTRNFGWSTTVQLTSTKQVTIYKGSGGNVDLSVAVEGYFTPTTAGSNAGAFTPAATRVYDSRTETNPIISGDTASIQVSSINGVPAADSGVSSVAVSLQVISGDATQGHVQIFADDADPGPAVQQFYANSVTSIFAVVPLGADGGINVQNSSGGSIDVVVDVEGWYDGLDPATTTCANSIQDGSWASAPAASAIGCQVQAPVAPSGGTLNVSVDGQAPTAVTLSKTTTTTTSVTIPAGAAQHTITTSVSSADSGPTSDNTVTFGSGSWTNEGFSPSIVDGSTSNDLTPQLWINAQGAPLTEGSLVQYVLSGNADLSQPLLTSEWSLDALQVPDGLFTDGATIYWAAHVKGPNNFDGSPAELVTPTWSFTATPDPLLTDTAAASRLATPNATGSSKCTQVTILAVRGTNASAGKGSIFKNVYDAGTGGYGINANLITKLKKDSSLTVYSEAIRYDATAVRPAYDYSRANGITNLRNEMNSLAQACPSTKIWLTGHSQGADVIDHVLGDLKKLSARAKSNFKGAVLNGDPSYRSGEAIDAAGNGTKNGKLAYGRTAHSLDAIRGTNVYGVSNTNLVKSFCYTNDTWCQGGKSGDVHNSYGNSSTVAREAPFLKQFVSK